MRKIMDSTKTGALASALLMTCVSLAWAVEDTTSNGYKGSWSAKDCDAKTNPDCDPDHHRNHDRTQNNATGVTTDAVVNTGVSNTNNANTNNTTGSAAAVNGAVTTNGNTTNGNVQVNTLTDTNGIPPGFNNNMPPAGGAGVDPGAGKPIVTPSNPPTATVSAGAKTTSR